MNDRRIAPRERAVCPLDILDAQGRLVGCMADVSTGGMRMTHIASPDDVQIDRLTLELPRWLGLDRTLELPGRFVWFREGPRGREAGFAFGELPKRKTAMLATLVEKLVEMGEELGVPMLGGGGELR